MKIIYWWMDARFRISGHMKNNWPKQQQKRSRNSKVTQSYDQWRNRSWKAERSVQTNFGDVVIFSLSQKNVYHWWKNGALYTKMVSSLSGKSAYHTRSKTQRDIISNSHWESRYTRVYRNDIGWKLKNCTEKSILCYRLFLEVCTHVHLGLHCCDEDAEEWP